MRGMLLILALIACKSDPVLPTDPPEVRTVSSTVPEGSTDRGVLVAYIGDQGYGIRSRAVLSLIRDRGADLVVHAGDFDYRDDPESWKAQVEGTLGPGTPYLAVIGNHDPHAWEGYQPIIAEWSTGVPDLACHGEPGLAQVCSFRGLDFFLGSPGLGPGGAAFFETELARSTAMFRTCVWHYNQEDFQVGRKGNQAGYAPYQACVKHGALIVNGHEHSYSRTRTLTDPGNESAGHGATGDPETGLLGPGHGVVVVSGLAGASRRSYNAEDHDDDTWWAGIYAGGRHHSNGNEFETELTDGVFFVHYATADPRKAEGWFENVDGTIIDRVSFVTLPRP